MDCFLSLSIPPPAPLRFAVWTVAATCLCLFTPVLHAKEGVAALEASFDGKVSFLSTSDYKFSWP